MPPKRGQAASPPASRRNPERSVRKGSEGIRKTDRRRSEASTQASSQPRGPAAVPRSQRGLPPPPPANRSSRGNQRENGAASAAVDRENRNSDDVMNNDSGTSGSPDDSAIPRIAAGLRDRLSGRPPAQGPWSSARSDPGTLPVNLSRGRSAAHAVSHRGHGMLLKVFGNYRMHFVK
eukprot:GHVU01067667.1.p1 GENE.GHVU01067667.1~~GHVU01067667.1.p1  ORF type:complete len:177 (+),score=17.00 GHVU01067667.1:257-787(+)